MAENKWVTWVTTLIICPVITPFITNWVLGRVLFVVTIGWSRFFFFFERLTTGSGPVGGKGLLAMDTRFAKACGVDTRCPMSQSKLLDFADENLHSCEQ